MYRVSLLCLAFLLAHWSGTYPVYGADEGLWLEEAQIRVLFRPDGKREVRQFLKVRSKGATFDGRVEHRLFPTDSEILSNWRIEAQQGEGNVSVERVGEGLETVLWARFDPAPEGSVSYELSFEVETDQRSRCPLAVPLADPIDPHSPVLIEVELPPGQGTTGMSFPNLDAKENLLTGWMGGVPAFVSVPHGEPGSETWGTRHGVDVFVLVLIALSIAVWLRYRTGPAESGEDGTS